MELSSEEYKDQLKKLHQNDKLFGKGTVTSRHYSSIEKFIEGKKILSLLDYGCGKGDLINHMRLKFSEHTIAGFDIASDEYSQKPDEKFDLVTCMDVLEHVEYGSLTNVLGDIKNYCGKYFICSIANYPAKKTLEDGRNAHITQLPFSAWFAILSTQFRIDQFTRTHLVGEAIFICKPLQLRSDWR